MAEIFTTEGLDYLLSIVPKGGTSPTTLYLGLYTSQTGSTAPTAGQTIGAGITEAAYTNYARVAIASTDWGTAGTKTVWGVSVRGVDGAQKSFPAATAVYAVQINGFFISTTSVVNAGNCIWASNFDGDSPVVSMAIGDQIKVTPTWGFGG